MAKLYNQLKEYEESDYYPYHMPGHKRRLYGKVMEDIASIDITEIDGFDNLHHAQGIIREIEQDAARLYGALESFYVVNGSTAGILSAIAATIPARGHILMTRNAHKAAYHAVFLNDLQVTYLWPKMDEEYDICYPVTAKQVEEALQKDLDIKAVFIVSPTYEGLVADVKAIAEVVHRYQKVLIVDSAHGAHFGFHPAWPDNCVRLGADISIQSIHKTLPAPTQTSLLHVNGDQVDMEMLKRYLSIYQTSSPSYVMMAAMEEALELVDKRGMELFSFFYENWLWLCERLKSCKHLKVRLGDGTDPGKLVISTKGLGLTGQQLYDILLDKYHLQMEMCASTYVLAMFTIGDTREGYERLCKALLEIDRSDVSYEMLLEGCSREKIIIRSSASERTGLTLREAWNADREWLPIEQCCGRIAGEFINLYPPGIPIIVPGEQFTEEILRSVKAYTESNFNVHGIEKTADTISVHIVKL